MPPLSPLPQVAQKPGTSHFAHGLAQLAASVDGAQASEQQVAAAAALAELLAAQVLQVLSFDNNHSCRATHACYADARCNFCKCGCRTGCRASHCRM